VLHLSVPAGGPPATAPALAGPAAADAASAPGASAAGADALLAALPRKSVQLSFSVSAGPKSTTHAAGGCSSGLAMRARLSS